MLDRMQVGDVAAKHHIQLRGPGGELRYEECFTRDGFDGPYSIMYHERRPHVHRVTTAKHGWAKPVATPERALAKRHYKSFELGGAGQCGRADRRAYPDGVQRRRHRGRRVPDGGGSGLHRRWRRGPARLHPPRWRRAALAARRRALHAGRLRVRPARPAPSLPAGGRHRAVLVLVLPVRRRAHPEAVAERGRSAPHGRAVLAPRPSSARSSRGRWTSRSASWSCAAPASGTGSRWTPRRSTSSAGTAPSTRGRSRSSRSSPASVVSTCRRRGTGRSPRRAR